MNLTKRKYCKGYFDLYCTLGLNLTFLQLATGIAVILIISVNIYLMKLIWKERRITLNLLLIILSFLDIFTGVVVFSTYLAITILKDNYCSIHLVAEFTVLFTEGYPWFMIVFIAIDRYFIVTKQERIHAKRITKKLIYLYMLICNILNLSIVCWYISNHQIQVLLKLNFVSTLGRIGMFTQILVTFGFYIHLLIYLYKKNKTMQDNTINDTKHENYSIEIAKTNFLILFCFLCCNVTYSSVALYINLNLGENQNSSHIIYCWLSILSYFNAFFNVVLFLNWSTQYEKTR